MKKTRFVIVQKNNSSQVARDKNGVNSYIFYNYYYYYYYYYYQYYYYYYFSTS